MMRQCWSWEVAALTTVLAVGSVGCESKAERALGTETQALKSGAGPEADKSERQAASCPAGRWRYDYTDQALEQLMEHAADAKVVEESGQFVCEIPSGREGEITCSTQGSPVVNVVETSKAGLPMSVRVSVDGSARSKFKLISESELELRTGDTSTFKVEASMKIAGREMPVPAGKLVQLFGQESGKLSYKCAGGKLHLKPQVDGAGWQELSPAQ